MWPNEFGTGVGMGKWCFETALARKIEEAGCRVLEVDKEVDMRFERKERNLL